MTEHRSSAHLLSISDLGRDGIVDILRLAESFSEVSARQIPKVPALRGRTVATLFFESSTRTRLSFEIAAKRLSADTMTFTASTSSLDKGESLRDTVETIDAMGVDAMVIRHRSPGVPLQVTNWVEASVINAGDGQHEHPTQALLDCYSILEARARAGVTDATNFSGLCVGIVGDIRHSRVARSLIAAVVALGARVILVAPSTLLPLFLDDWPVEHSTDLDAVLSELDVCYLLRLQSERMEQSLLPSVQEYVERYCLNRARAKLLKADSMIMHPGPMKRGIEIEAEVTELPNVLVTRQVRNGVAVRMAVLFSLLGAPREKDGTGYSPSLFGALDD